MDCSGLWHRWINIGRGQYLCAAIGVAIYPWQLLASATTFLTFLNGFGVILAPMM
jgi:nucleobase:cation symporter-1, NCS1 family